jgi:hypothetical protein
MNRIAIASLHTRGSIFTNSLCPKNQMKEQEYGSEMRFWLVKLATTSQVPNAKSYFSISDSYSFLHKVDSYANLKMSKNAK